MDTAKRTRETDESIDMLIERAKRHDRKIQRLEDNAKVMREALRKIIELFQQPDIDDLPACVVPGPDTSSQDAPDRHPITDLFIKECCILKGDPGFDSLDGVSGTELEMKYRAWCAKTKEKCPPEGYGAMQYLSPYLTKVRGVVRRRVKSGTLYVLQFKASQ